MIEAGPTWNQTEVHGIMGKDKQSCVEKGPYKHCTHDEWQRLWAQLQRDQHQQRHHPQDDQEDSEQVS